MSIKTQRTTDQSGTVDAERRPEVSNLVEIVLETFAQRVAIRSDKIRLHLGLADHAVPAKQHHFPFHQHIITITI